MKNKTLDAILTISEPWDKSCIIYGVIEEITLFDTLGLLFKVENGQKYFLSKRYSNNKIEDAWKGKELIVNILEVTDFTGLSKESIENGLIFSGIGSVKTM